MDYFFDTRNSIDGPLIVCIALWTALFTMVALHSILNLVDIRNSIANSHFTYRLLGNESSIFIVGYIVLISVVFYISTVRSAALDLDRPNIWLI